MANITLQLNFTRSDSTVQTYQYSVSTQSEPTPGQEKSLADELSDQLRAEINMSSHLAKLPLADGLAKESQRTVYPTAPMDMHDVLNADGLWLEIQNTLYAALHSLAESKAYKDLEPVGVPVEQWSPAHANKLAALNTGVLHLAKIQDLVVRLLFESFGGDKFIAVDLSDDDWEKALTMKNARQGLKRLRDAASVDEKEEYANILDALDGPSRCPKQQLVIKYRNCVVHRIRPSIDHPEFSPLLQDRVGQPLYDDQGRKKGGKLFHCRPV